MIGALSIVVSQALAVMLVESDHDHVRKNSYLYLLLVTFLGGQGAYLVVVACLQAVFNETTVIASHLTSGLLIGYFFSADGLISWLKQGMFPEATFAQFYGYTALASLVVFVLTIAILSDDEDESGLIGKGEALSKGVLSKNVHMVHMLIGMIFCFYAFYALYNDTLENSQTALWLAVIILFNLFVPVLLLIFLSPDRLKEMIKDPSDTEKMLSDKGDDVEFGDAICRPEFWLFSFGTMTVIGCSYMVRNNLPELALYDSERVMLSMRIFQVCQAFGAMASGLKLSLMRSWFTPSVFMAVTMAYSAIAQGLLIYADSCEWMLLIATGLSAACSGGLLSQIASYVHEELGTADFGKIYGSFATAACLGLLIFDECLFSRMFDEFADDSTDIHGYLHYGDWNKYLFGVTCVLSVLATIFGFMGHWISSKRSSKKGVFGMVKF